jgi:ABC-type multidrug transport system fused ATPase/permease subunit
MIIFFCSQGIVSLVTFGSYVGMGNILKSDVIFPSLALLTNAQYFICIALQFGMEFLAEVYGACDRVDKLLKERNERSRENSLEAAAQEEKEENEERYAIRVNRVSGYWGGDDITQSVINLKPVHNKQDSMTSLTDRIERAYTSRAKFSPDSKRIHPSRRLSQIQDARRNSISAGLAFFSDLKLDRTLPTAPTLIPTNLESVPGVLTNISISLPSNKLTVITGPVGSGKSLLLNILLKELPIQQGNVSISGSISYYDQNPCIINSTIRENILFGKEYNAEKYEEVVNWCGLGPDFSKFPRGDESEVGEKGSSLSGGQRARIALARTLYSDRDIIILDDPLSALDANLAQHIIHNCLKSMSRYKTVILVTHSKAALGCADWLLVMNSGRVSYLGTPEDYMKEDRIESDIIDNPTSEEIKERDVNLGSEIISIEEKSTNSVPFQTYWCYINSGLLNSWTCPLIVILSLLAQGAYLSIPLWLGYWADAFDQDDLYYLETFCILVSALILLSSLRNHFFYQSLLSSNSSIHNSVLNNLLHARCSFYDMNPSGRILNRVGQDISRMDSELPYVMVDLVQVLGIVAGLVLVTIIINPIMIVVCTILLVLSIYTYRNAMPITRNLRRAESLKASELQSLFISTIDSLVTIRSLSAQAFFQQKMQIKLHEAMSAYFWYVSSARWMNFRLDLIAALFSAFTSFAAVANKGLYGSGYVGASLVFSLQIVSYVVWMVRQLGETENTMTSTERVMQYQHIEQEGELDEGKIEITEGKVKFDRVWMKYQEGLEPALKNVSFKVKGKKIGIVGRSGSGKSTILQVLMRLSEIYEGSINIDDVEISSVGLHNLRKNIAVISQNTFLMQTTIRKNLDITQTCSDDEIFKALHKVKLSNLIRSYPNKLDTNISDLILSQGQKQLLCVARVLLNKKKILILDEATASIDTSHEALIRKILNSAFSDCTIIEIAHKPSGILDAENVLVLENGAVKDLARTEDLLKDPESVISRMLANK